LFFFIPVEWQGKISASSFFLSLYGMAVNDFYGTEGTSPDAENDTMKTYLAGGFNNGGAA